MRKRESDVRAGLLSVEGLRLDCFYLNHRCCGISRIVKVVKSKKNTESRKENGEQLGIRCRQRMENGLRRRRTVKFILREGR